MSKERLEELKDYLNSTFTDNNYEIVLCEDIGIPREQLKWLIRFAEDKDKRVQELEYIIYQDERQAVLEGLYEQNKRYREALEFYADEGTYEVVETLPPTDEYQQPIEPVFKTVPIIYYDKGKEAREALEE